MILKDRNYNSTNKSIYSIMKKFKILSLVQQAKYSSQMATSLWGLW